VSSVVPFTCSRDNQTEGRKVDKIPTVDLILEMLKSLEPTPDSFMCPAHSRELEFFCNECGVAICPKCLMGHRQHDYIEVEQATQMVSRIRTECIREIDTTAAQFQNSKLRLNEIQEARMLHEQNLKAALENLKSEFDGLHENLKTQYSQDEARLIRDSFPMKNYIDQHEEHQKLMQKKAEEDLRLAERTKAELMKCDSNIAVLARLKDFSFQPIPLESFDFDFK
jgi:superfamily II helicase